ncbi:MAG: rod shape-determining protein MreC [Bacteroidota bacterium]
MRNLINFIWKNNYFFLFAILQIFSLWLIVENSIYQRSSIISSSNRVSGSVLSVYHGFEQYFFLRYNNDELARENALLLSNKQSSFQVTNKLEYTTNDTLFRHQFSYFEAKVISNSVNKQNNYLILNKGQNMGIEKEMAVISPSGMVGIVKDVSPNFCSVISLLHQDSRVNAKIKRTGFIGTVLWDGVDYRYAKLIDIPYHLNVRIGDTIVTSGYSTIFPEGVMIGTVAIVKPNKNDNFYNIAVKLFTDFNRIDYVYIVKNRFKSELDTLTSRFKQ